MITQKRALTCDLGGTAGTEAAADAVLDALFRRMNGGRAPEGRLCRCRIFQPVPLWKLVEDCARGPLWEPATGTRPARAPPACRHMTTCRPLLASQSPRPARRDPAPRCTGNRDTGGAGGGCPVDHLPESRSLPRVSTRPSEVMHDAANAGATIIIHENFRFQPWYRAIRAALDRGAIGQVHQMTLSLAPRRRSGPRRLSCPPALFPEG